MLAIRIERAFNLIDGVIADLEKPATPGSPTPGELAQKLQDAKAIILGEEVEEDGEES